MIAIDCILTWNVIDFPFPIKNECEKTDSTFTQKRGLRRERSALDRKAILVDNYEYLITQICTHIEIYVIHFWKLG